MSSYKKSDPNQVEIDIKCLKILRTLIHNEERKLPDKWEEMGEKSTR